MRTLNDLIRIGKIRYIGSSNFKGYQIQKAVDIADKYNLERFVSHQPRYSLLDRTPEEEQLEVCRDEGLAVLCWGPTAAGFLAGKYNRNDFASSGKVDVNQNSRAGFEVQHGMSWNDPNRLNTDKTWQVIEVLNAIAKDLGKTPAQVALNWIVNRPVNVGGPSVIPILGPRNLDQLNDLLGSVGWQMKPEQYSQLTAVSALEKTMPGMMLDVVNPIDKRYKHF